MCHNEIAFRDEDHTGLVVPALGILFHQGAQTRSLGGDKRVVLDVVGREPPFRRREVALGKSLSEEFADDGFVALRVVRHVCVLLRSITPFSCSQSGRSCRSNGSVRMRLPVAAKTALASAGAVTAVPGSPIPPGASLLRTRCTSIAGVSLIRSTRTLWKFDCSTRPFLSVTSPHNAPPMPNTTPPSICALTMSGFTTVPQSTAQTTRCTRTSPASDTETSATWAT